MLVLRIVLGALVLLLVAFIFIGFRLLQRLPNTVIYFVKSEDTHFVLEPVYRHYEKNLESQLKTALEDLIGGPTSKEAAQKLYSSVPQVTRILDLEIKDHTVRVNLSTAFTQESGLADLQGRLNQVLYTLSQAKEIDQVELLIEGQPLNILGGEGLLVDNPWKRISQETLPQW